MSDSPREALNRLADSDRDGAWIYEWYRDRVANGEAELPAVNDESSGDGRAE